MLGEAALKPNYLIEAINFFGARKANGWSVGFRMRRTHAVNMEYHKRPELARILFVLVTNYRFGRKDLDPKADPRMRLCPYTGERFFRAPFRGENEASKHARRMLCRLITLRYHGASRSVDCLPMAWSESADAGHLEVAVVSKTDLADKARVGINRLGTVVRSDQKAASDAMLPGKAASIVTSWFRKDAALLAKAKASKRLLHFIRTLKEVFYCGFSHKMWRDAQIFAGVPVRKAHSIKKISITDLYLGSHSITDIAEYDGTSEPVINKNYRLKDQKRVYRGPAYQNGPGVPPSFRAEEHRKARERGLPYPF